ncbi:MAG TPA: STAS domain-containing protein [Leptospiraceae bacterium]|nr:STAS domain-containing protein [Leptospiraceae bacterium]
MQIDDEDRLTLKEEEDVTFIQIKGNIDLYTTPELKDAFDKLNLSQKNKIIIDLLNVDFIDSSGLGILVTQALYLQKRKLVLKFINVNSTISHVFSLGGFTRSFKRFSDKEEAMNSTWEFGV